MLRTPMLSAPDENPFDHPLISAFDARRQFVVSTVLISAFAIFACLNWLA